MAGQQDPWKGLSQAEILEIKRDISRQTRRVHRIGSVLGGVFGGLILFALAKQALFTPSASSSSVAGEKVDFSTRQKQEEDEFVSAFQAAAASSSSPSTGENASAS